MGKRVLTGLTLTVFALLLTLAFNLGQADAFTNLSPDGKTCTPCHTDGRTGGAKAEPAKNPAPAPVSTPAKQPATPKAETKSATGDSKPNSLSVYNGPTAVISINGVMRKTEVMVEKGVTYIPARSLGEYFEVYVDWDNKNKAVIFRAEGGTLTIFTTKKHAAVNDQHVEMKAGAKIVKGRAYIPVKALAEALGGSVETDSYGTYVNIPALKVK